MKRGVLWDSSAILALLDADDADHQKAVVVARQLANQHRPCFISNYIEAEAHALLLRKLGRTLAREWLLRGKLPVIRALPREEEKAKEIITLHEDKNFSLCDAISFAVIELRGASAAFTFDHHFQQYGRFEVVGLK